MRRRLERVGLVRSTRGGHTTLDELLSEIEKTTNVKPGTKLVHGHARRNLRDYFGKERAVNTIRLLDAETWRQWLGDDQNLAPATLSKRLKMARQFFAKAVDWDLIVKNPFAKVRAGGETNDARQFFVGRPETQKILDKCPEHRMEADRRSKRLRRAAVPV